LQSERIERHRSRTLELVEAGKAYRCYRTRDELETLRANHEQALRWEVLRLPEDEQARREAAGEPHVVRMRMPAGSIRFTDLVRGEVDYPPEALDDFVLLRSDGSPTYHLSVVCDDLDMGITHVLRGEDHVPNTPKHIALIEALGGTVPTFGHLPMILGPDKKRLSKRTGAASVEEFREQGVLPQALYNYLALLGWSPGEDRELMSRDEMAELFTVERLIASPAVFDVDKLSWMNGQYLRSLPLAELMPHVRPFLAELRLGSADPKRLEAVIELHRERAKELRELAAFAPPYFSDRLDYDREECAKFLADPALPRQLEELAKRYNALDAFDAESLEATLRALAEELGVKAAALIHPTRMALTASKAGPSLFHLVEVMGRPATAAHYRHFQAFLHQSPS
jgi:glutamyl-tRNA synthetase